MSNMSILTTSGITNYINTFKQEQVNKRVLPLSTKKNNISAVVSIWGNVSSKLYSLKSVLSDLAKTGSESVFQNKTATSSDESVISAKVSSSAVPAVFNIKVNQLAKNDILMSNHVSDTDTSSLGDNAQSHRVLINDGDYYSFVDVSLSATSGRTSKDVMNSLQTAINADYYAKVIDGNNSSFSQITLDNSNNIFKINLNGSIKNITLSNGTYNSYDDLVDEIVSKVNAANVGVSAEKVDGKLKISSNTKSSYVAVDTDTEVAQAIGFTDNKKYKAASDLASVSVFSPLSGNSRLSIMAKSTGSGKLNIADDTGSNLLNSLGISSSVIADRNTKLNASQATAGWVYLGSELDAQLEFNGVNVTKKSNSISDLVSGVTFELESTNTNTQTITITENQTDIKSKINDFISKFNDVYTYVKNNMSSGSMSSRGKLAGDQTAYALLNEMKKFAEKEVTSAADIKSLKEMGITFNASTGLSISDTSKFNNAIQAKLSSVEAFFNTDVVGTTIDETNMENYGFAKQFNYGIIGTFLDGKYDSGGTFRTAMITNLTNSYNKNITQINNNIDLLNKRIDKEADVIKTRLNKMQNQLAQMMAAQGSFNSFFGGYTSSIY